VNVPRITQETVGALVLRCFCVQQLMQFTTESQSQAGRADKCRHRSQPFRDELLWYGIKTGSSLQHSAKFVEEINLVKVRPACMITGDP
jgi:hypothetical protein